MKYQLYKIQVGIEDDKVMWSDSWEKLIYFEELGYFTHKTHGPLTYAALEYFPTEKFYQVAKPIGPIDGLPTCTCGGSIDLDGVHRLCRTISRA